MKKNSKQTPNNIPIREYMKNLEARIARIEGSLDLKSLGDYEEDETEKSATHDISESSDVLEFNIGQFWFARFGIVVLAVGIVFLLTFPYNNIPSFFPSLFGYVLVGGILWLSHFWRKSFTYISQYLLGGGLLLLYFSTLRLYFFSVQPVLENKTLVILFLMLVVIFNLYISVRKKSVYLTCINFTLGYATAIVSDSPYFLFILTAVMSGVVVYFTIKYKWEYLIFYGILLTYFTHLVWFINNPFLGNPIQFVSSPQANIYFILLYALIFALGNLYRGKNLPEDDLLIANTFLNCVGCYGLYLIITLTKMDLHLTLSQLLASSLFIILSIIFWLKEESKFSTFFYAILGYSALGASIIIYFPRPDYFIFLCWESLLVVITALWFRSKIIIVANFVIFLLIVLLYLLLAAKINVVSISFGVVALLSARIMNWQKHRLDIKTEFMRNTYLSVAFIMFPYALYHMVPGGYVGMSWIAVAIFYYILGLLLKNPKYRWMAVLTLLLTVSYLFIIGAIKLDPTYRIISFIGLGIILLFISLMYARIRMKSNPSVLKDG
jgi:hypothetical protein